MVGSIMAPLAATSVAGFKSSGFISVVSATPGSGERATSVVSTEAVVTAMLASCNVGVRKGGGPQPADAQA